MKKQAGFTLIELILYIAIVTFVLVALTNYALSVMSTGAKSSTEQEIFSAGRYVSERIKYEIRNASGINSVAATSISLSNTDSAKNPTVIALNSGQITVKYGTSTALPINSANTSVNSLVFTNFSSGDNKTKNIRYVFTIAGNFGSNRQEYVDSTTIENTAEVRSN